MRHKDADLPEQGTGSREITPAMREWQAEHAPTLTLRVWVTDGERQVVSIAWAGGTAGEGPGVESLGEMGLALMAAEYKVKDAMEAVMAALRGLELLRRPSGRPN